MRALLRERRFQRRRPDRERMTSIFDRSSLIEYALRSSGPKTEAGNDDRGEMQSVRRTAETVVVALEDTSEITQAFEAAIFADYDA